jgi:hypothetical protein
MPRFLVAVLAVSSSGCFFDAKYREGVPCGDGMSCPSGLTCHEAKCVSMIPIDMSGAEMPPEGPPPSLTCADPGVFPATGGSDSGTTAGTTSKMSSTCGGFVNNGPDRVYKITMNGTNMLRVHIDAGDRKAYVLAGPNCIVSPSTPACIGGVRAQIGNPITLQPAAGDVFIVVDDELAGGSGTYTVRTEVF